MMARRVMNLWRAVVGSELTQLEVRNAEALLDVEREQLRGKIAQYNLGLAGYAAISEKLKADIARLAQERSQLEPKLRVRLAAGDRVAASRLALRLELIDQQVEKQHNQREQTELTYRELTRARELSLLAARDRMDALKR